MQNKRRILKRLLKEVVSKNKGFLINESWNFEKKENKQALQNLYNTLEREGFKQIVSKLKTKNGLVYNAPNNVLYISLFDKNDIQALLSKQHFSSIILINKKTNEYGMINGGGHIRQNIIKGDQIRQIEYKLMDLRYFTEKPKIVKDKYWGMKALLIKPEGSVFEYVFFYK